MPWCFINSTMLLRCSISSMRRPLCANIRFSNSKGCRGTGVVLTSATAASLERCLHRYLVSDVSGSAAKQACDEHTLCLSQRSWRFVTFLG